MTSAITVKDGLVSTHGIMKVEFAIEGLTKEEVELKLNQLLNRTLNISMIDVNDEVVELETFGYTVEQLQTFEEDEF